MPVEVSFIRTGPSAGYDQAHPVASHVVTASGTPQVVGTGAVAGHGAIVVAVGQDVRVSVGASPNAETDANARLVPAGATRFFYGLASGDRVSVVTV